VVPLVVGALIAWYARFQSLQNIRQESLRVTKVEFIFGAAVTVGIALLVTVLVGPGLARDSAIGGYHEFYNGSVVSGTVKHDECHRDGSCARHYSCDPYTVRVTDSSAYTDSNGNYHPEQYHYETRYHQCPYVTEELDYVLATNIGKTYVIGDNYFDEHPREWRGGSGIPSGVPTQPPERWTKAVADLRNGMSDPVTGVFSYENFILASDSDLYKEYEGSIEAYQKAGLLPKHTGKLGESDMLFDYDTQALKVQAAGGLKVKNLGEWQNRLMRFNAALGSDLQGDMHIVLLPAAKVSNPDDYITALKAYWDSLGKWSISKNGIILVIGVSPDGKTVEWSRAQTGMPKGNEEMLSALDLKLSGEPFDPGVLLGDVSTNVKKETVKYDLNSGGSIGKIVFHEFPFARACMKCNSAGDKGVGYVDLSELVPITTGAKVLMFCIVFFLSAFLWAALLAFNPVGYLLGEFQSKYRSEYP
jgi:hypothetical protein